jgi:hypothetical protein
MLIKPISPLDKPRRSIMIPSIIRSDYCAHGSKIEENDSKYGEICSCCGKYIEIGLLGICKWCGNSEIIK